MLEHFFSAHPVTTHLLAVTLGGPAFGILVNMLLAAMFGKGSKATKIAGTYLSTLPSLVQAVEAVGAPGQTQEEHTQRILSAIDAAAQSIKLTVDKSNATP